MVEIFHLNSFKLSLSSVIDSNGGVLILTNHLFWDHNRIQESCCTSLAIVSNTMPQWFSCVVTYFTVNSNPI
jgi:hypothetical protein